MIQKKLIKKIVFFRNLTVEPTSGLRSWLIHEYDDVQDSYSEFKDEVFFLSLNCYGDNHRFVTFRYVLIYKII